MGFLCLIIGSFLSFFFLLKIYQGRIYEKMMDSLDSNDYPWNGLYGVGLSWSETEILALKGKVREILIGQARILYHPQYAEYYANITWAQILTYIHFILCISFLLAGVMNSLIVVFAGMGTAAFLGVYFFNRMNRLLKIRETECKEELPEVVSTMALLIHAGMPLRNAWEMIAENKKGSMYQLMQQVCSDMNNGVSESDAIHKLGRLSNSQEVRKFTSALSQSLERGGSELGDFLGRQSFEMWTLKKQLMLQKGEAAASKLLAPTAMLFVAIIIAVFAGALGMLI